MAAAASLRLGDHVVDRGLHVRVGQRRVAALGRHHALLAREALQRILDYPLGRVTGRQALAVRTTDSTIHTWDLARAIGVDDTLDAGLVGWIDEHLDEIYAGLAETPVSADSTHRFFAAPGGDPGAGASTQDRLLHRMGRAPSPRTVSR